MHERFFASKGKSKTSISSTHFSLTPQNADTLKELHILTFGKVIRHASLFLHHIPILFRNVTCVNVFLRPGADKFRVNNVISCPASYIYYSTKHNDGVEDYLDQTDNG